MALGRPENPVQLPGRCPLTNPTRAMALMAAVVWELAVFAGTVTGQQTRTVSGMVETLSGTPLSAVEVHLTNGGSATTSDSGAFSISLGNHLGPGDPIEISLGEEWIVVNPWEGKTFVPVSFGETLHVRVCHKGDQALLVDPQLVKRIVESATSSLGSGLLSANPPDQLLNEKSRALGFSLDQLTLAIEEWNKMVRAPYDKGLAALYAKHYAEASRYIRESVNSNDSDQVRKYIALSKAEIKLGRYSEAEAAATAARAIEPSNMLVLGYLGQALEEQAKYKDAEDVFRLALAIDERAFGPEHPLMGIFLNNVAVLCDEQGKYSEAEQYYRRSLQLDEQLFGPEDRNVATDLNNLAALYREEGRYPEAEPLYKRSIEIGEKTLGPNHLDVATRLSNLAILYNDEGRYAEAEPLYKRALAIQQERLGPEHPHVATTLNNLSSLYWRENRFAEAESFGKRALSIWEKTLGPDHPLVGTCLNNLATLYDDEQRYAEAEPLFKRSLEITEKAVGLEHPDVANHLNNLGMLYVHERKFAEAEAVFRRALAINEKALGSEHAAYAVNLHNLGVMYTDMGEPGKAVPMYEQALKIDERALGQDNPTVAGDLTALAVALRRLERNEEADLCEEQARKIQASVGRTNPNLLDGSKK